MSPLLLLLLPCLLAATTALGAEDQLAAADLAPSDSSLHYVYGHEYGHHATPYGGHVGGYQHTYGHVEDAGYGGYGHHGYTGEYIYIDGGYRGYEHHGYTGE